MLSSDCKKYYKIIKSPETLSKFHYSEITNSPESKIEVNILNLKHVIPWNVAKLEREKISTLLNYFTVE